MKAGLVAAILVCLASMGGVAPMKDLVPSLIDGWKSEDREGSYDRKTLYSYIDGGAEVYLAYDFRKALARRFVKKGQPAITLDLFDMGTSQDAYGVFTFEREDESIGIGQDSEYAVGFLRFWKGTYFASILADRETPASRKAVLDLAKSIAAHIQEGKPPAGLSFLPSKDLIRASIRFFHEKSGLDYHFYLADKNVLNLSRQTDVLLAQYKMGDAKAQLILVGYPDAKSAQEALDSFTKAVIPDARDGIVRLENGKWVMVKSVGSHVIIVFDCPSEKQAKTLVESVEVSK